DLPLLPSAVALMMAVARTVGLWFLPVFCHFFLIFPDRSPLLRRFPNLERRLYWPFYLILPWFSFMRFAAVFREREQWAHFFRESWLLRQQWIRQVCLLIVPADLGLGV